MQNKQAIFIVGAPGSGKDVVIRDITSNYNVIEFAATQIDEMLSNDASFKRALPEKQESLLERHSIVITANSFNLNFVLTKQVLESIGYSTHLILVEADLSVSIERLKNRNNLKESLDRIATGNANRQSILGLFNSHIIVDNSKTLDLSEARVYILDLLSELSFKSDLTLEDIAKPKIKKKLKSVVPGDVADTRGMTPGSWSVYNGVAESYEVFSFDTSPIATSPMQKLSSSTADMRSDDDKERTRKVLGKIKKINFKKVVPYGIG